MLVYWCVAVVVGGGDDGVCVGVCCGIGVEVVGVVGHVVVVGDVVVIAGGVVCRGAGDRLCCVDDDVGAFVVCDVDVVRCRVCCC